MNKNYCALVVNNIVEQIIVADFDWVLNNLAGEWINLGGEPLTVGPTYSYDPNTGTFTPPPPPPDVLP